jgi:hypothetical protein
MQCYLIEPIFDERRRNCYPSWDERIILGWRNPITDERHEWPHQFGAGAMWLAVWYPKNFTWVNETGPHLIVKTPGGEWDIDSRASNCTMPEDKLHRCWIRQGIAPAITVNKQGLTCDAGAGSIAVGNYHGFLIQGEFT